MKASLTASVAVSLLMATPALSSTIDATNPQRILELAKGYGSAELTSDSRGDPKITGRMDGTSYTILFYGCKQNKNCTDIQFKTGWGGVKVTLSDLNNWHKKKRYGKAFLDDENDPILEMNVNLRHGVSADNLDDTFDWWKVVLKSFRKDVLKED